MKKFFLFALIIGIVHGVLPTKASNPSKIFQTELNSMFSVSSSPTVNPNHSVQIADLKRQPVAQARQSQVILDRTANVPLSTGTPISNLSTAVTHNNPLIILDNNLSIKGFTKESEKRLRVRKNQINKTLSTLSTGTWFTRHNTYNSGERGYRLDILKPDSLPDNKFLLYNLAGLGTTIEASYDANSQTISIPQQIIYKHETFGEFSILPLAIKDGGLYITDGAIEGVLNNDGSINMGIWGVIVTQKNDGVPSEYYGKALSVFTSTIARKSNATHTYQNPLDSLKTEVLPILALQTSPYKMEIQGLTAKANSEILHARISSTGKMIISPQVIFTHSTYGDFKCYPVKYVTEADQLKYILDKQGVIEFTINGTNAQAEGMIVAGSVAPSKYISSMYKGLNIDFSIPPSIPSSTGSEFTGKGTEESPYIISNVSDYIRLAENVEAGDSFAGKYFKLDNDLDFASSPEGAIIPIGTPTQPFEGNFNGNNHTIMNISMDRNGFLLTALFGNLGKTGKISNLNIKDSQFKSIGDYIGTVAAYCSGTISNCHIFNCKLEGEGLLTGGIAGLSSGGKIENCSFNGQISGKGSVGGIVGQALAGSTIIKCNSAGKLTHEGEIDITACDLAGICGTLKESTISECYSSGSISDNYGRARVGGLIGRSLQGLTERSFTTAVITAKRAANDENADSYTGGIVAYTLESEFNDCYSSSSIIKTQVSETIGGICGNLTVSYVSSAGTAYQMIRQTYFRRCFYTGQMRTPISNPKRGLYGTTFIIPEYTGPSPEDLCFIDCWYDGQVNFLSESKYGKKTSQVTESALQNYDSNIWEFIPGYYPALKAFGSDNKVQAVAKAPLVLRNEDTAKKSAKALKPLWLQI